MMNVLQFPFAARRAPRPRPLVEALEGREAPAVFTVTVLTDSGTGSLRDAITQANANPGADIINFQAGLTGTVSLTSPLPTVSDSLTINGPGATLLTVRANPGATGIRVFTVNGPGVLDVTFRGLTIGGGYINS